MDIKLRKWDKNKDLVHPTLNNLLATEDETHIEKGNYDKNKTQWVYGMT